MRFLVSICFLLLVVICNAQIWSSSSDLKNTQDSILNNKPEFYVLQWKPNTVLFKKETNIIIKADTLSDHQLDVLVNRKDEPVLYTSKISTPVCADGECKFMNIELYWTLLGDYAGFNRYKELPLTKHDHEEFLDQDYLKLHQLLVDDNSILDRRTIDELVEKPKTIPSNDVDALSGATIAEVKESVVSGALYSCFTAWHLVHGAIKIKLRNYTKSGLSNTMLADMLTSNHINYQLFTINNLNDEQFREHSNTIVSVFKKGTPLVRSVIVKNLSKTFTTSPKLQEPFWEVFSEIDINSKSLLLGHLDTAPKTVIEALSLNLEVMSKNQLKQFLNYLSKQKLSQEIIKNLSIFANSDKYIYAYLVEQFLEE